MPRNDNDPLALMFALWIAVIWLVSIAALTAVIIW